MPTTFILNIRQDIFVFIFARILFSILQWIRWTTESMTFCRENWRCGGRANRLTKPIGTSQQYTIVENGLAYRPRLYCRESRVCNEIGYRIGHEQCDRKEASVRVTVGIMRIQCRRICTCTGNTGTLQSAYTFQMSIYFSLNSSIPISR